MGTLTLDRQANRRAFGRGRFVCTGKVLHESGRTGNIDVYETAYGDAFTSGVLELA